ncbi:hypothetical protein AAC387_Pa02g3817 [Persea americana]
MEYLIIRLNWLIIPAMVNLTPISSRGANIHYGTDGIPLVGNGDKQIIQHVLPYMSSASHLVLSQGGHYGGNRAATLLLDRIMISVISDLLPIKSTRCKKWALT